MFAATFFALLSFAASMAPVAIPRCCPEGNALRPEALASGELHATDVLEACVPVTNETAWAPGVYVNARNTFLPVGQIPPHWQLQYSRVPVCRTLRVMSYRETYMRADNGRFLTHSDGAGIALEGFCADTTVTLVCAHVFKCCDVRSVFDGAACIADKPGAREVLRELAAIDESGAARFGWPACATDERHAAVGELSAARYDARVLLLRGERYEEGAWCAEANRNDTKQDVLVFACARVQSDEGEHEQRERQDEQQYQVENVHEKVQKLDKDREREETPSETSCSSWNALYIILGMALMGAALLAGFASGRFCLLRKETRGLYKRGEGGNVA